MSIDFEFDMNELMDNMDMLEKEDALDKVNREALKDVAVDIYSYVQRNLKKSEDNSKSGRKGSRPFGHAKDNIPKGNIKKKNGFLYITVGWEKGDRSEYFYEKFQEWGTTKIPAYPVFSVAKAKCKDALDNKTKEKLEKFLNEKLGV